MGHHDVFAERQGRFVRLRLVGEIDLAALPNVARVARQLCLDSTTEVVADLSEVTFIDSTGLDALAGLGDSGATVSIRNASDRIRLLMRITGLDM